MIQERQYRQAPLRLTNSSQQRGAIAVTPEKTPSYVGLAKALGVGIIGYADKQQERYEAAAAEAYRNAQLQGEGKSEEVKAQLLVDARSGIADGDTLGFFDKLLVDESDAVKVYDERQAITKIHDAKAAEKQFYLENRDHMSAAEMTQGLADIYRKNGDEMKALSDHAYSTYLKGSEKVLNSLQSDMTEFYTQKAKKANINNVTEAVNLSTYSIGEDITGLDEKTIANSSTDPVAFKEVSGELRKEPVLDELSSSITKTINKGMQDLISLKAMTKEQAYAWREAQYAQQAQRWNSPELYEKLMNDNSSKSGSVASKNPKVYKETYKKLVENRFVTENKMRTIADQQSKAYQIDTIKALESQFTPLTHAVKTSVGEERQEAITTLNNAIEAQRKRIKQEYETQAEIGVQDASLNYARQMKYLDDVTFGTVGNFISDPKVVSRANDLINHIAIHGPLKSVNQVTELRGYGNKLSQDQAIKASAFSRALSEGLTEEALENSKRVQAAEDLFNTNRSVVAINTIVGDDKLPEKLRGDSLFQEEIFMGKNPLESWNSTFNQFYLEEHYKASKDLQEGMSEDTYKSLIYDRAFTKTQDFYQDRADKATARYEKSIKKKEASEETKENYGTAVRGVVDAMKKKGVSTTMDAVRYLREGEGLGLSNNERRDILSVFRQMEDNENAIPEFGNVM